MRTTRLGFRIWLAMASVTGFLGGWILLAHSPKPAQPAPRAPLVEITPLPTLEPLPSPRGGTRGLRRLPSFPQVGASLPRLRTGGS